MYLRDFTVFVLSRSHTRRGTGWSPKREVLTDICEQNSLLNSSAYLVQVQGVIAAFAYIQ
jgi:hypothetical protein